MTRKYLDEQIATIMQESDEEAEREARLAKEIEEQNLASGETIILGQKVSFKRREFIEGKISMIMPEDWSDLPLELAKLKYPHENRPKIILTDKTTTINFTIHYLPQPLECEDVAGFAIVLKEMTDRGVRAKFWEDGSIGEEQGQPISWFDFTVSGFDTDIYNFAFCTSLEHKALLFTFNCDESVKDRWQMVAYDMMASLLLSPSKEENSGKEER